MTLVPCARIDISLGIPKVDVKDNNKNEAYIRMYPKAQIKMKTTVLYYDFTTLVADIGGYAGMFLGLSVIDIVRIMNKCILAKVQRH